MQVNVSLRLNLRPSVGGRSGRGGAPEQVPEVFFWALLPRTLPGLTGVQIQPDTSELFICASQFARSSSNATLQSAILTQRRLT
jgi:hypothetical protein